MLGSIERRAEHEAEVHLACGQCGCVFDNEARVALHTCPGEKFLGSPKVLSLREEALIAEAEELEAIQAAIRANYAEFERKKRNL